MCLNTRIIFRFDVLFCFEKKCFYLIKILGGIANRTLKVLAARHPGVPVWGGAV